MALCHDERDFAMGFSRYDPHAQRGPSSEDLRRRQERAEYLNSLTGREVQAYTRVELCLAAVGQYLYTKGEATLIRPVDLHKHFPIFAKEMGYRNPLYHSHEGVCQAVTIAYPQRPGTVWLLHPDLRYAGANKGLRETLHTPNVRRAALKFCKAWLPNWNWDDVKLP